MGYENHIDHVDTILDRDALGFKGDRHVQHTGTKPRVFRLPFVIAFNASLVVVSASVVGLWRMSKTSDGYNVSNVNHYLLTYGPTAILILFVAAWRQVDYHIKVLTPWHELSKSKAMATRSLLLDYLSTFQAVAFWSAIKNRHTTVILTTVGFVLLKVATLSSTGLLVLEPALVERHTEASLQSQIGSGSFNANTTTTTLTDQSLVYTTYGILAQNLQKPFGLGKGLAFSTFSAPGGMSASTKLRADVDAFVPSFTCQSANVTVELPLANTTEEHPKIGLQIQSPACSLRLLGTSINSLNPQKFRCPSRQLSGFIRTVDCPSSVFNATSGAYKLVMVADMRYAQTLNSSQAQKGLSQRVQASSWSTSVASTASLVCRLSYAMRRVQIQATADDLKGSAKINDSIRQNDSTLPNFTDDDLESLFRGALSASNEMFGDVITNSYASEYPDTFTMMMASVAGGSYENLLDSEFLSKAAGAVSTQLAAQIAHQYLRDNETTALPIETITSETHLKVSDVSAWSVVGTLACTLFVSITVAMLCRESPSMFRDGRVGWLASLLPNTDSVLTRNLITSQSYTESQLRKSLSDARVNLVQPNELTGGISMEITVELTHRSPAKQPWWHPLTISKAALAALCIATIGTIAALEAIQRVSDASHGFITLSDEDSAWSIAYTHYLPALTILLLASMFNCLDFNVLILSPFSRLKKSTMLEELEHRPLIGQWPAAAVWASVKKRYSAAVASSLAAFVGSLMTIVVSGLYTTDVFYQAQSVPLRVVDSFLPAWSHSVSNDSGAAVLSSLTENLNLPDSLGTFDQIAVPSLSLDGQTVTAMNTTLEAELPVWRAHLDCESLTTSNYSVQSSQNRIQNTVTVNATYGLPPECTRGGSNGTDSVLKFVQSFNFPTMQNNTFVGKMLDLHVGPYDPVQGSSQGESTFPGAMNDNPNDCPSLAFIYGFVDMNGTDGSTPDSVAVQVCYQKLQRVNATFHFLDSNFTVDSVRPPQVDEKSVEHVSNSTNVTRYVADSLHATAFQYRIQSHFDGAFSLFNTSTENPWSSLVAGSDPTVDNFFQGVIFGRVPIPFEYMKLENQDQKTAVDQGILAFYRRYMAKAISLNMRSASTELNKFDNGNANDTFAMAIAPQAVATRRVVQHNSSKIVLQSMLGFMLACVVVSLLTIKLYELLPATANPCTIWGQMSILAGSNLCDGKSDELGALIDNGGSGWKGRTRVHSGQCQSIHAKLGWWDTNDGAIRYGIDVVEEQ
ncbi:hypothetical protein H2198_001970 [Neophaeococcomyces mojaviensis]|uniref:Uncharacterized protein n=1 Tax=Neophaeococcomyces mojaviensis TaxID=3383035 RepID=A0ACC3AFF6_9EURO|nr:hypothetical protein H2198_001970 [Knufia sp. JES_112]